MQPFFIEIILSSILLLVETYQLGIEKDLNVSMLDSCIYVRLLIIWLAFPYNFYCF